MQPLKERSTSEMRMDSTGKLFSKNEFLSSDALRAASVEFVAILLFVFLGAGSVVANMTMTPGDASPTVAISLANGLAIVILVFVTINVSGGHINPAVTFAVVLTRKMSVTRGVMYVAAQLVGAVSGAALLKVAVPGGAEGNLGAHMLGTGVTAGM